MLPSEEWLLANKKDLPQVLCVEVMQPEYMRIVGILVDLSLEKGIIVLKAVQHCRFNGGRGEFDNSYQNFFGIPNSSECTLVVAHVLKWYEPNARQLYYYLRALEEHRESQEKGEEFYKKNWEEKQATILALGKKYLNGV